MHTNNLSERQSEKIRKKDRDTPTYIHAYMVERVSLSWTKSRATKISYQPYFLFQIREADLWFFSWSFLTKVRMSKF